MNAVLEVTNRYADVKPVGGSKKKKIPFWSFASIRDKWNFKKMWYDRNLTNGDVFVKLLEVDDIVFEQNIFVEYTAELVTKLKRLEFEIMDNYPNKDKYDFARLYYNKAHNLAVFIHKADVTDAIKKAYAIVNMAKIEGETAEAVFVSTINTLSKK